MPKACLLSTNHFLLFPLRRQSLLSEHLPLLIQHHKKRRSVTSLYLTMPKPQAIKKQEYPRHPFLLSIDSLIHQLSTNQDTGLSPIKAQESQRNYGPNKLEGEGGVQWYSVLFKQISNAMILVRCCRPCMALSSNQIDENFVHESCCLRFCQG